MRLDTLSLAWFRGAGETTRLAPKGKSLVVYGSNGAGKSSFADAFEYIITHRVGHLAHEYSGVHQQKALRNTHAPQDVPSELRATFTDDSWLAVNIRPNGTCSVECNPPELATEVQAWDLEHYILRQDEVAHFIHATKGEKYSALLPLLGLSEIEFAAANLGGLQKALTEAGSLAQKKQRLDDLQQSALQYLPDLSAETIARSLAGLQEKYLSGEGLTESAVLLEAVSKAVQERIDETAPDHRRHLVLQQIYQEKLMEKFSQLKFAEAAAEVTAGAILERQIAVLETSQAYLSALEGASEIFSCPACGREIAYDEFGNHLRKELEILEQVRETRRRVIAAREALRLALGELRKKIADSDLRGWLELPEQEEFSAVWKRLSELDLSQCEARWQPETWETLSQELPRFSDRLNQALRFAPPSTHELINDLGLIVVMKSFPEINRLERQIKKLENLSRCLNEATVAMRAAIKLRTQHIVSRVSSEVQSLWSKLHPDEPIERIELYIPNDADKAIDIRLKFFGIDLPSPRLSLSEGHRNSLGLCIFLALVRLEHEPDRVILLDDVVSSLDREHRGMLTRVLFDDFTEQQMIVLTHDREWYTELRGQMPEKYWDFVTLRPWEDPKIGIQTSPSKDTFDDARSLIPMNSEAAGNRARAIMDLQLAYIAEKLRIRVAFARGERNDRRTCIELLERIMSEAKTSFLIKKTAGESRVVEWVRYTEPHEAWLAAHGLLVTWGNRASHGGVLTRHEAELLIDSCEKALEYFRCEQCGDPLWMAEVVSKSNLQCSCGEIRWKY